MFKVGHLSATAWLEKMHNAIGHLPKITNLNLQNIKTKIEKTREELDTFNTTVNSWQFPVSFPQKRSEFLKKLGDYEVALAQVKRQVKAVSATYMAFMKENSELKTWWRTQRNKYRSHLGGKHVNDAMCKTTADVAWSQVCDPAEKGITLKYYSPECALDENSNTTSYKCTFIVRYKAARTEDAATHYEILFGNLYLNYREAVTSTMRECVQLMRSPEGLLASAIGGIPVTTDLDLDFKVGDKYLGLLKHVKNLTMAVRASWCELVDLSLASWPFRSMPVFLQLFVGRVVVVIVDRASQDKIGDLATYLNTADAGDLFPYPTYYMNEGDAVFIPNGSLPVICAIPITIKMDKNTGVDVKTASRAINERHPFAVGIHPVFDSEFTLKTTTPAERVHLHTDWTRAAGWIPDSWKQAEGVIKYIEAITAAEGEQVIAP